jgi:hypothetical protein
MADVRQDIATYAGWSENYTKSGLAVHGIFVDETPNLFSANSGTYLDAVTKCAKDAVGILGDRIVSDRANIFCLFPNVC